MTTIPHINGGFLHKPPGPRVICRCLRLEDRQGLALVDRAGFPFDEADTAVRQIEKLGFRPADVKHIVLTHGDPDHVSALAAQRATDDALRRASLEQLRRCHRDHGDQIALFGYHDPNEFPQPRVR